MLPLHHKTFLRKVKRERKRERERRLRLCAVRRTVRKLGVGGRALDLIRAMFSIVVRTVFINSNYTEEFDVEAVVPQGFLYAVYINGLHRALCDAGLGMFCFGRRVPLLLYADDIVLLARSADELRAMLAVLDSYARQWRFQFNQGKSNVVIMGTPPEVDHGSKVQ